VLNNFYGQSTTVTLPEEMVGAQVLLSNYQDVNVTAQLTMQSYQAVALLLG
jgi:trehalose-6-phosphate hydrolase